MAKTEAMVIRICKAGFLTTKRLICVCMHASFIMYTFVLEERACSVM